MPLQAFYAAAEQIEELKRSATFPKLTPPSPDFLGLMEEYVANTKEEGKVRLECPPWNADSVPWLQRNGHVCLRWGVDSHCAAGK